MKLLVTLLSVFVSIQSFASSSDEIQIVRQQVEAVRAERAILDPLLMGLPFIESSMIGSCIENSDLDPYFDISREELDKQILKVCLVYSSRDANAKAKILAVLAENGMVPTVQIRVSKPFGRMELQ